MANAKYRVYSLDVWGSAEDGFEVNDRSMRGEIELDDLAPDKVWVDALISEGFLNPLARGCLEIDGDDMTVEISDDRDGCPVLTLERID